MQGCDFDEGSFLCGAGAGLVAGDRGHVPAPASAPSHWLQAASALLTEEQPASQVYIEAKPKPRPPPPLIDYKQHPPFLQRNSQPPRYMHSFRVLASLLCALCLLAVLPSRFAFSVGDPDPQDPHVCGPPRSGSGSISRRYGSWSFPFPIKMVRGLN